MDLLQNTYNFTQDEVGKFKKAFDAHDKESQGLVRILDFRNIVKNCDLEYPEPHVRSVLVEYAPDGSDEVDFQEIVTIIYKLTNGPSETEIRQGMLEYFDDNLDGLISIEELVMAWDKAVAANDQLEKPSDDVIRAMLNEADLDQDGFLNENEFFAILDALKESDDENGNANA